MPPFAVSHIDHLVLRVQDIEASIDFYRQALGCVVVRRRDDLGLVRLRAGSSLIDLVSIAGSLGRKGGAAAGAQGRNLDHLCLRIDPFDEAALRSHLLPFGLDPAQRAESRFGAQGDGLSLYFSDPDGNVIELKGPASPA